VLRHDSEREALAAKRLCYTAKCEIHTQTRVFGLRNSERRRSLLMNSAYEFDTTYPGPWRPGGGARSAPFRASDVTSPRTFEVQTKPKFWHTKLADPRMIQRSHHLSSGDDLRAKRAGPESAVPAPSQKANTVSKEKYRARSSLVRNCAQAYGAYCLPRSGTCTRRRSGVHKL